MNLLWPDSRGIVPAALALALAATLVAWSYARAPALPAWFRLLAALLKIAGFALLLLFLLDPQILRTIVEPGRNWIAVAADNSASMGLADQPGGRTRGGALQATLADPRWRPPDDRTFRWRDYAFDGRTRRAENLAALTFDGPRSDLQAALGRIASQFAGQPLSAIIVFTDGAATDLDQPRPPGLPPVYAVLTAPGARVADAAIERVTAANSAFESAPVTIDATIHAVGAEGRPLTARLLDARGAVLAEQRRTPRAADEEIGVRFLDAPAAPGPAAYRVTVGMDGDTIPQNNAWNVVANREGAPRRVLYVGGQPNWEHKFLARALADDPEIKLVSLLRIARAQAKVDWRAGGGTANPLYRGSTTDAAERSDEPVFLRLGTRDAAELRGGFPRTAAELFPYDEVILDGIEAAFFTRDQLALLRRYVAERGGSLVMLGGADSFDAGGYDGTPLAEALPVYLGAAHARPPALPVRVRLTREGMLQPWMRLRAGEREEAARLATMPAYLVANGLDALKPGAEALATLTDADGRDGPAIASQRFGLGRATAFLVGDWWRWGLRGPAQRADLDKFWRQALRGLLADTPRRAALATRPAEDGGTELAVTALGPDFRPAERSIVTARVRDPDGRWTPVDVAPDPESPGRFTARIPAKKSGPWLAEAVVTDEGDGSSQRAQGGWAIDAEAAEFRSLRPDPGAIQALVRATGGRVVAAAELPALIEELKKRPASVTGTRAEPLWHHGAWLALALACLAGEWSLRRGRGLA